MRLIQRLNITLRDERFSLSLLVGVTGLVLTLQNPLARESASDLLSRVELPNLSQVLEMRPGTPPPAVEGDQLIPDEIEDVQPLSTVERADSRSREPRQVSGR